MIFTTKRSIFLGLVLPLVASCSLNYNTASQVIPVVSASIFGVDDIDVTDEMIMNRRLSFVKINFGKSSVGLMSLLSISSNNVYEWISEDDVRIYTFNGKIIKTLNLNGGGVSIQNGTAFLEKEVDGIYDINLHQPEAFVTQDYSISKELDESGNILIKEFVKTNGFKWEYTNTYLYSDELVPIQSEQEIHPNIPKVKLTFYFKKN